jgi:hypothetical protein
MKPERTHPAHLTAPTSAPRTEEDIWAGDDSAWLEEEEFAQRWLDELGRRQAKPIPFAYVLLACVLGGAGIWALIGYGIYRLIT